MSQNISFLFYTDLFRSLIRVAGSYQTETTLKHKSHFRVFRPWKDRPQADWSCSPETAKFYSGLFQGILWLDWCTVAICNQFLLMWERVPGFHLSAAMQVKFLVQAAFRSWGGSFLCCFHKSEIWKIHGFSHRRHQVLKKVFHSTNRSCVDKCC